MNRTVIGILFMVAGVIYGSMAIDRVYSLTLGWLISNNWVKPPKNSEADKTIFGRKITILLYAFGLILIGIYILWSPGS
ncbi:MAG: hypothetical protein COT92_00240 [Candidatus Doudnabacteria bacterium CG10_big_fil_rev_8_21_14_0_10_42_18]|uniref:Uncharacterized protein n=1 Tax=Candidatus Doudnabacteria bacterium CG10_big_fil_rev_8_21_14_0_10_42_18 TaxID=1974552 RepID=A0A2H0VBW7_9BACT|nr:MAG: hypothetical protein COT92_00240 [Candidatus Doudnabacteria bacterium CG10_big_fil_rev_8_21_14_0_10_42_18]